MSGSADEQLRGGTTGERVDEYAPPATDAHVQQVTILKCDIVGSTRLKQTFDLGGQLALKDAWRRLVDRLVAGYAGARVAAYEGDGAFVVFGFPDAREDMAECTIRMALALLDALRDRTMPLPVAVEVRVGIASGPVAAVRNPASGDSEAIAGLTIDLAERLRAAAAPGSILVSDSTRALAGETFVYEDMGNVPAKGFEDGLHAWRVVEERPVASRFDAGAARHTIVGREPELRRLARAWHEALDGRGNVACLRGEAGIGKSLLANATLHEAAADGARVLDVACTPSALNSPLHPIGVLLRRTAGITASTPLAQRRELAHQLLARILGSDEHALEHLAPLFGLDPARSPTHMLPGETRERTIATVVQMLRVLASEQPVAVLVEDLHWVDDTTRVVLSRVAAEIDGLRALMIVTTRPGLDGAALGEPAIPVLDLAPLDADDSARLVRIAGGEALRAEQVAAIVAQSEGVPLLLEEVTRDAVQHLGSGGVAGEGAGRVVPSKLQLVVQARLARAPDLVPVAQAAAVLGRETSLALLRDMLPTALEQRVEEALARLAALGIVDPPLGRAEPGVRFRHAMIGQAVYATLLPGDSQRLHGHAADLLLGRYKLSMSAAPDTVAEHLRKAQRFREAIAIRISASEATASRGAYVETRGHCEAGLGLIGALPASRDRTLLEVTLLVQLAVALTGELGYAAQEVEEAYLRAQRVLGDDADPALQYPIMRGLATFHLVRGELREAHAMAQRAAALAERSGRADFRIDAASVQCYTTLYYANLEACHRQIEACLALYHEHRGETLTYPVPQDAGTAALALLPTVAWLLGDAQGAEEAIDRGIAHVEQLNRDFDRALMHAWIAGARFTQRRYAKALEHAGTAMTIARHHNYGEWHGVGALMALLAQAAMVPAIAQPQAPPDAQDRPAAESDPLAQAATICAAFQQRNVGLNGSYYLWGIGQGHLRCGNAVAAQAVLDVARAVAARSDETRMEAELLILSAQLASTDAQVRAHLSDALHSARQQGAVPVALRAAAMLALHDGCDAERVARAREALACLDATAPYPADRDWMPRMLAALAPA